MLDASIATSRGEQSGLDALLAELGSMTYAAEKNVRGAKAPGVAPMEFGGLPTGMELGAAALAGQAAGSVHNSALADHASSNPDA